MKGKTEQSYSERILRVLVYIQQHLDDPITLDELARVSHFSSYHFHRIFRGLVGETVKAHIRRLRLERAAFRLIHTDQAVTSIAFDAGYETHEAFTRSFRSMFGTSPSQFRKQHQQAWHANAPSGIHFVPRGQQIGFDVSEANDETVNVEVEFRAIPSKRVAFMRHVGPYLESIDTWRELMVWAEAHEVDVVGNMLGICYDDPAVTSADRLRYDACIILDRDQSPSDRVGIQALVGGEFAVFRHEGAYEQLAQVYETLLGSWLPASGREVRDSPCIEVYRRSPFDAKSANDLVTEVCVPLVERPTW